MMKLDCENGRLSLTLDGVLALAHSPDAPFVTAVRREKTVPFLSRLVDAVIST